MDSVITAVTAGQNFDSPGRPLSRGDYPRHDRPALSAVWPCIDPV